MTLKLHLIPLAAEAQGRSRRRHRRRRRRRRWGALVSVRCDAATAVKMLLTHSRRFAQNFEK